MHAANAVFSYISSALIPAFSALSEVNSVKKNEEQKSEVIDIFYGDPELKQARERAVAAILQAQSAVAPVVEDL